jgi:hypothetical protein
MDRYPNVKDIEICAVKLRILSRTIIIMTVYRSPTGNIAYFLNNLEAALNQVYNNIVDIIFLEILILIISMATRISKI